MTQALYRKWRPQTFDDVVGQDHVSITLKNQIASARIGHAYLFVGSRGCGKTTSARLLAREVNIAGLDPKSAARVSEAISDGHALDVIEIDAASHNGVDAIREIIDRVNFQPSELKYKVYIIDEVHMLSTPAFNALLKTLEEPPAHVIFILATTDSQKIPATITSRCQRHTFKRVPVDKIAGRLRHISEKENIDVDDHALKLIARSATGSLRDAVSLLDQLSSSNSMRIGAADVREALGATDAATVRALAAGIAAQDVSGGFDAIQAAVDQGADARQIARQMVDTLRALMQIKVSQGKAAAGELSEAERVELADLAERLSVPALSRAIKAFSNAINEMRSSGDAQLPLEMAYLDCVVAAEPAQATAAHEPVRPAARPAAQVERVAANSVAGTANGSHPAEPKPAPAAHGVATPGVVAQNADASGAPAPGNASDTLMNKWKDFVRDVKKNNMPLAALLNSCQPQGLVGNVVQLKAAHDFARQNIEKEQNAARLKQALSQWLGIKAEVSVFVTQSQQLDPNDDPVIKKAKQLGGNLRS